MLYSVLNSEQFADFMRELLKIFDYLLNIVLKIIKIINNLIHQMSD